MPWWLVAPQSVDGNVMKSRPGAEVYYHYDYLHFQRHSFYYLQSIKKTSLLEYLLVEHNI